MAGIRRRYNLEKLIAESNVPVVHELPAEINVNQLKWGLRSKLESLNAITQGQDMASAGNYPMVKEQMERLESLLEQEISALKNEITKIYQLQAGQKSEWSMIEVERRKEQEEREAELTEELQDKWQNVLEKINDFPQAIEEQLQLQQSVFVQEISGIIAELAILRQDKEQREQKQEEREAQLTKELQDKWQEVLGKIDAFPKGIEEQLQLQQSMFMQEISTIISELVVLQQDKEQRAREQMAAEIRHLLDEMEFHMLEEAERQKEQEERELQLTKELQDKWQDVLGRIEVFPQGVEDQLQLQQSMFMQEFSRIISELAVLQQDKKECEGEQTAGNNDAGWDVAKEVRHLIDEMGAHMLEEDERQKKREERESQLTGELQDKWQDVLGRIEAVPQGIEEQLQLQQNVLLQEISKIISELAVLQQDKEEREKEQAAGNNAGWNVVEEVRHLIDEMGVHMLGEVEWQRKQEEREVELTKELQDKWQEILGKIDVFPQGIEEQLKLQQSVFMQEFSKIIFELTVLQQDKKQREREQTTEDNAKWSVVEEIRHLMDEIKIHMLEESNRQKKKEERETELTKELQNKWQDALGKIDGFPQAIEDQLQPQQDIVMPEISTIISELVDLRQDKEQREREQIAAEMRRLMDKMELHMLEEVERQKEQEERDSQLKKELQDKWQEVLGKIECFPEAIEEQLQRQQSVFVQEISKIISEWTALQQEKEQWESEQIAEDNVKWNITEDIRNLIDEMKIHLLEEVNQQKKQEEREMQLTKELQNKWQDALEKIDAFLQVMEEQLQLQQNVFIQDVSEKIEGIPQAIREQLQLEQNVFIQDVSEKIEGIPQAIKEQLQLEQSVFMQDVSGKIEGIPQVIKEQLQLEQSVFMQDVSGKIEGIPQAIKEQLQLEQSVFMQDVSGKIEGIPQVIKEQLQLEQSVFMQDVSGKIEGILQVIKEQLQLEQGVLMQDVAKKIEGIPQTIEEKLEQSVFIQDVSGKSECIPQAIEEQLQLQQNILMQEFSKISSEVAALQQDKEQQAGEYVKSNVVEEVRHLQDEIGTLRHMLEEVAGYSRRLTEILQQKDLISKDILLLKVELTALRKAQEQANQQIEQRSSEESIVCPQTIEAQLQQQGTMLNQEILSLKEDLAVITQLHAKKLRRRKRHH